MTSPDPIMEALALLRTRRDALLREVEHVQAAIHALDSLDGSRDSSPAGSRDPNKPSVRAMSVSLMEEEDREWSAADIIAEYQRRGTPVHGKDPSNALRAALADAKKRGLIVSTRVGRYRAAKWEPANGSERSSAMEELLGRSLAVPSATSAPEEVSTQ